mgnify:CR=1 FL=1
MQDFYVVTGMVISQMPVGEFDRRVCILTCLLYTSDAADEL